jgi:hypothetical protein
MKTKSGLKKEKYTFTKTLPFWIKRTCKICGEKLVAEKKSITPMVTKLQFSGKTIRSKTPFPITIKFKEYTCPACNTTYSIEDLKGKENNFPYYEI